MINDSIDNLIIDLNKPALRGTIYVRQGDTRARTIHIRLTENGKVKDLSNASLCELLIKKPDGNQCDQTMVRDGNELQYTFRTQDINVAGECFCQVMVNFRDGGSLVSPDFTVMVYEKVIDQALEKSTNEYSALATIKIDVEKTKNDMDKTISETLDTMTDIQAKADSSANSAALSASASAIASAEAQGHALSAKSYEETASGYVDTVAGLATVVNDDKEIVANNKEIVAEDKEIVAGYLDQVIGIAATKVDKKDPTSEGDMYHAGSVRFDVSDATFEIAGYRGNVAFSVRRPNPYSPDEKVYIQGVDVITELNNKISGSAPSIVGPITIISPIENNADILLADNFQIMSVRGKFGEIEESLEQKVNDTNPNTNGKLSHQGNVSITKRTDEGYVVEVAKIDEDGRGKFKRIDTPIIYTNEYGQNVVFWSDINIEADNVTVLDVGATIVGMQNDIDDLKHKPSGASLTLTSASPLSNSTSANILGIDALGKSEQDDTQNFTFTQGAITPTVGSVLNQDISANNSRCTSNIIQLPMGSVISAPSGYEIYLAHATTENGNIDIAQTWVTTYTTTVDGYWRVVCRNKNNTSATITPSECKVVANVSPTPTNPIPIKDASAEVVAETKNLFNPSNTINAHLNDDSYGVRVNDAARMAYAKCKPNTTYTVSKRSGQRFQVAYVTDIPADGLPFYGKISNPTASSISITTGANAKYIVAFVWLSSADTIPANDMLTSVQIEEGSTATSYVPYQSNTITLPYTLKSVGEVKDELIVNEDGTGKLIQNIERKKFKELGYNAYDSGNRRFVFNVSNVIIAAARTLPMLCDCYTAITDGRAIADVPTNSVYASGDGTRLYVHDYSTTDGSTLLATIGNMYVYYPLATPIETPLTASEVASIRALQTYDSTTIVESEMEIATVDYTGDIKGYVDSKTDYSYTDQIIGKWADGKDLHRMVIRTTTPSAENTDTEVAILPNGAIVKRIDGTLIAGENTDTVNFYYGSTYYIATWVKSGKVRMRLSASYTNKPCEIVIEYTLKNESAIALMSLEED